MVFLKKNKYHATKASPLSYYACKKQLKNSTSFYKEFIFCVREEIEENSNSIIFLNFERDTLINKKYQ
jgi:hypothetical protein